MAEAVDPATLKIFADLGKQFDLEDKVVTWLTSRTGLGARTLDDFVFSCDNPKEVKALAREASPENELMAVSRLRQAWHALKRSRDAADEVKRVGQDTSDMDELLPSAVLDDIESRHWNRYKMTWPPDMSPADTVVSRIVRELDKRTLGVREVFKVRTQAQQQRGMRKRTKLANGIEMLSAEAEEQEVRHTTQNYLAGLHTLLIAYSKAGSKPRADAPESEPKTMDSTMVVECPMDILMRYFYRVQDRAWRMPYSSALDWVLRHDEAERTVWVDLYRNSKQTLGEVIKHTASPQGRPCGRSHCQQAERPVTRSPRFPQRAPRLSSDLQGAEAPRQSRVLKRRSPRSSAMGHPCAATSTWAAARERDAATSISAARSSMVAECAARSTQQRTTVETPRPPRNRPRGAGPAGRRQTDPRLHWTCSQERMRQWHMH